MDGNKALQRFVIFSSARSGSGMLQTLLDGHSQIKCYGETFNPSSRYGYVKWMKNSFYRRTLNKYFRDYLVDNYLDSLFLGESSNDNEAIGFKVMYPGQFNRCSRFRYYWWINNFKIIRLTRRNLLRRFVSSQIAAKEGVWKAKKNRGNAISIKVDTNDLIQAFYRMETWDRTIDSIAQEFRNLMVDYESLISNRENIMRSVYSFLSVNENEAEYIKPKSARQNPSDISELIENYDEVYSALQNTQYEYFL